MQGNRKGELAFLKGEDNHAIPKHMGARTRWESN
jgi:hypothetical protein